ncbi:hypothetical protein JCM10908_005734 [Rhodotorula pacifica]|uniref:NAD(P)/FAD-dependent oxidoreductase n=1 Tax=Rhodotorula pacifica TaxID=1495444 RepID=UPI00316E401A
MPSSINTPSRLGRYERPSDVVILGSGIIGLCSALEIVKLSPTSKVVLVEASPGKLIAGGASSYAGGFIACGPDWHDPPSRDLARLSWECHSALAAELDGPDAYGWRESGAVGLAVGGHGESRSKYRTLPGAAAEDQQDAAVDWLEGDREQLSTEGGVAQIDPALFCQHLFRHLETAYSTRFRIVFGRATRIEQPAALAAAASKVLPQSIGLGKKTLHIHVHEGNHEDKISFDRLLVACGPWSAAVCETLDLPPIPLTNLPGHSLLIRPAPSSSSDRNPSSSPVDLPPEAVFAGIDGSVGGVHASTSGLARGLTKEEKREGFTRSPEFFVRRKKAGEDRELVYVAGENSIPETPTPRGGEQQQPLLPNRLPSTVDGVKDLLDEACVGRLKRAAGAVSPLLKEENGAVIEKQQFCYRPISSDRQPIVGALRSPDMFVATGHGPWGICLSAGTGRVVAEMMLGRPLSADISGLSVERFTPSARL